MIFKKIFQFCNTLKILGLNKKWPFFLLAILILGEILFISIIFVFLESDRLYGDEVFYWFQSRAIRENFKFINFQNTQPLLFPLFLSFFQSINSARIFNSIFIIFSILLFIFYLIKNLKIPQNWLMFFTLFSLALFFSYPFTTFFATSLHTEALFTVFLILSFLLYPLIIDIRVQTKLLIAFGLVLGLAMQTRITGIILFLYFLLHLLISKKFKLRLFVSFGIALIIFLPYLYFGGLSFLFSKSSSLLTLEGAILVLLNHLSQAFYFWWPFLILIYLGITQIFQTKSDSGKLHFWFIIFILTFSLLTPFSFPRYWFILTPSIIILICFGFEKLTKMRFFQKPIRIAGIFLLLFLLQIATAVNAKTFALPNLYYKNHFFVKLPSNCTQIEEFLAIFRDTAKAGQIYEVKLPLFQQPPNSIIEYIADFKPLMNYNYLVINYIDDQYFLSINGEKIRENIAGLWEAQIIEYPFLENQQYFFNILVFNSLNIGGIGQILICKENPYH